MPSKKSRSWKLFLISLALVFASYFTLNYFGVFGDVIPQTRAIPDGIFGNYLSGDRDYTLQEIDVAMDPLSRKSYYVWEMSDEADMDIGFAAYDYGGNVDWGCLDGAETRINSDTSALRQNPAVAANISGDFVIVWSDNAAGMTGYDIVFSLYDSDCNAVVEESVVNTTVAGDQSSPRVAMDSTGAFVIVWEGNGTGDSAGIFARGYNAAGVALDANEYRVNTYTSGTQEHPDIAIDSSGSGEFLIVWNGECDDDGDLVADDTEGICAQGYKSYGTPTTGGNQLVNITGAGVQESPRIAASKGASTLRYIVTWQGSGSGDSNGIYARRGVACTASICSFANTEISVNTSTSGVQSIPVVDTNFLGDFAIAWLDDSVAANQIKTQVFSFGGGTLGSETTVSNNGFISANEINSPTLAMSLDGYFVTAFDACIDAGCEDGGLTDSKWASQDYKSFIYEDEDGPYLTPANGDTYALGGAVDSDIAVDPQTGNYAVVWSGDGDAGAVTDDQGVWLTLRERDGDVINSVQNVRVNTMTAGNQNRPKVAFFKDDSTFVVCFDGQGDTDGDDVADDDAGIFYRSYSATGVALDDYDVQVNQDETNVHQDCAIDAGTGGDFVVTWYDSSEDEVFLAQLGTNGTGSLINPSSDNTPENRQNPAISMNSNNDFVWVWDGKGSSDAQGIYMEKGAHGSGLDSSGEVRVNSQTADNQQGPAVHLNDDGLIFVAWDGGGPAGDGEIYGRGFDLNDTDAVISTDGGAETQLNQSSQGTEETVDLDGSSDGDFVVSWFTDSGEMPATPLARWINLSDAAHLITKMGPDFYLAEANTVPVSNSDYGPAYNAVGVYDSGDVAVMTRTEDGSGHNITGIARKLPIGDNPSLTSTLQQEVLAGGRTLVVPSTIAFPALTANAQTSQTNTVAVRDDETSDEDYIEVQDLFADGNSYSITLSIGTSFTFSGSASDCTDNNKCISDSNLEVRNYDQNGDDVTAVFGSADNFNLDNSTDSYQDLSSQRTLGTGTGDEVGRWRFFPDLRLTIPAETPPGTHTVVLTFSLS